MRMKVGGAFALIVAMTTLISSCGEPMSQPAGGSASAAVQSSASPSPSPDDGSPSTRELREYFQALATDDPATMSTAIDMAAPGSNAEAYAIYLSSGAQADRDGGFASEASVVEDVDGGFSMCPENETEEIPCNEFTDIKHEDGKIADFQAGDTSLNGRIILGDGQSEPIGDIAEAEMIAAYRSIAGHLVVVFEVKAEADEIFLNGQYRTPEGRQSAATYVYGPSELGEGSLANFALYFEGADIGGDVTLEAYSVGLSAEASSTFATE